jgi:nucleotide-binding universal stress UspA family protein
VPELAGRGREILAAEAPVLLSHAPSVAVGLHELVRSRRADLLVVGAHHARHLVSHDHTRDTVRDLPCAVAVATWGYAGEPRPVIRKVGVGYTDDKGGREVLDTARGVAFQLGAEVHATTVVPPSHWEAADSGIGYKAAAAARRLAEIPGVHGEAVEGVPHRALAVFSTKVDLLVIGSRHHRSAAHLLRGDIAAGLSHAAHCPVIVVPHSAAAR